MIAHDPVFALKCRFKLGKAFVQFGFGALEIFALELVAACVFGMEIFQFIILLQFGVFRLLSSSLFDLWCDDRRVDIRFDRRDMNFCRKTKPC